MIPPQSASTEISSQKTREYTLATQTIGVFATLIRDYVPYSALRA